MNHGVPWYMMLLLIGVVGIAQATVVGRIAILGVKPDLVLLIVLMWTLIYGGRTGVIWAFIGGIWLDIFSGGPLGASSLGLIAASLIASIGHRTLSRRNMLIPIAASILGTLAFSLTYIGIIQAIAIFDETIGLIPFQLTIENIVIPSVLYNTILMVLAIPLLNQIPESSM